MVLNLRTDSDIPHFNLVPWVVWVVAAELVGVAELVEGWDERL